MCARRLNWPAASIRLRLTLSHLAVIVIAMGASGVVLFSLLNRYFMEAVEESLLAQAQVVAQALIPGSSTGRAVDPTSMAASNTLQQRQVGNIVLQTQNALPPSELPIGEMDPSYLSDASLELGTQLTTRIRLLNAEGLVLLDSWHTDRGRDESDDPLVRQALAGQRASWTDAGRDAAMHVALPVVVDGKLVAAVYLSQSLNDVRAVLGDLRTSWWSSMAAAVLLSAVVGLLLSRAIAQPIRRLRAAAEAVAEGQLDHKVPIQARDELGRLGEAFNDMTSRLRAARQMQTDFVANVSHELRTPLTAVKGLVETLRDGAVDDRRVRDRFLASIEDETDRLIRLVNNLLLLSRLDSEALELSRQGVDLAVLARKVSERLTAAAVAHNVTVQIRSDPSSSLALADPDRIEQVLVNLVDNAIKYSRPGGEVTIWVERGPGQSPQVRVQDHGVGISVQDLPRIGERFYRTDRARSRTEGGTGLGLAIAQALVEAQGGKLWLHSQEGQGTVVGFTLPAR